MEPFREISEEEKEFVEKYKREEEHKYPKPAVTADIAIFSLMDEEAGGKTEGRLEGEDGQTEQAFGKKLKLLLIKRGGHPCKDMYALPGGFVNPDETIDQAAARELKEETGIDCEFLEQVRTFSDPGRDPRSWTITGSYLALLDAGRYKVRAGDDAKEALWFEVSMDPIPVEEGQNARWSLRLTHGEEELRAVLEDTAKAERKIRPRLKLLESENLAFDHGLIIAYAIVQLREWMDFGKIVLGK